MSQTIFRDFAKSLKMKERKIMEHDKKALILRRRKLGLGSCLGIRDASETGIDFVRNDTMKDSDFEGVDLVFRWGCTANLPIKNVVNKASAIHTVADKSGFRKTLLENDKTKDYVPRTAFTFEEGVALLNEGVELFVRPKHHSQGKNYDVVSTPEELQLSINRMGQGWYAGELISKSAEYRYFVVQGRVAWVAEKTPADPAAIVWNVAQGGKFEVCKWGDWHLEGAYAAVEALQASGLDFGGVDLMLGQDGHPYVIEINSAPSQTSPYRQSCTAKAFDYIVKNGKDNLGYNDKYHKDNWRHFIHPAIWPRKKKEE